MQKIRFYYISLSGNTSSFVQRVSQYIKTTHHREVESLKGKSDYGRWSLCQFFTNLSRGGKWN